MAKPHRQNLLANRPNKPHQQKLLIQPNQQAPNQQALPTQLTPPNQPRIHQLPPNQPRMHPPARTASNQEMTATVTNSVRSMTGQGHASNQSDLGVLTVELRTVNNRGFKCSPRLSDSLASLESRIEGLARSLIHRGSVLLNVNWRRPVIVVAHATSKSADNAADERTKRVCFCVFIWGLLVLGWDVDV